MKRKSAIASNIIMPRVRDIKAIEPLAEVITFSKDKVYLIILNKPKVISSNFAERNAQAIQIQDLLTKHGISALYAALDDENEIRILELKGDN